MVCETLQRRSQYMKCCPCGTERTQAELSICGELQKQQGAKKSPQLFAQDICGHLPSSSLTDSGHTCVGVDYPKVGGGKKVAGCIHHLVNRQTDSMTVGALRCDPDSAALANICPSCSYKCSVAHKIDAC